MYYATFFPSIWGHNLLSFCLGTSPLGFLPSFDYYVTLDYYYLLLWNLLFGSLFPLTRVFLHPPVALMIITHCPRNHPAYDIFFYSSSGTAEAQMDSRVQFFHSRVTRSRMVTKIGKLNWCTILRFVRYLLPSEVFIRTYHETQAFSWGIFLSFFEVMTSVVGSSRARHLLFWH